MAPRDDDVKTSAAALVDDAKKWVDWANDLDAAARLADQLTLSSAQLMGSLSGIFGLPEVYNELQSIAASRARQGRDAFDAVANALFESASAYIEVDDRSRIRVGSAGEQLGSASGSGTKGYARRFN